MRKLRARFSIQFYVIDCDVSFVILTDKTSENYLRAQDNGYLCRLVWYLVSIPG